MKLQSINPHDQSIVGELEVSSVTEVSEKLQMARSALVGWSAIPVQERGRGVEPLSTAWKAVVKPIN